MANQILLVAKVCKILCGSNVVYELFDKQEEGWFCDSVKLCLLMFRIQLAEIIDFNDCQLSSDIRIYKYNTG
jgi:hypothetical protein